MQPKVEKAKQSVDHPKPTAVFRIKFENRRSTCLEVAVDGQTLHEANSLMIMFRGDDEMVAALECLEFLVTKLKAVKEISTS